MAGNKVGKIQMSKLEIPFNKIYLTGSEELFVKEAIESGSLSGDGTFTKLCSQWIKNKLDVPEVLLTPSGTAALEMAALLIGLQQNDEVIMPSYTFSSTANAFILHGGVPVFVDIDKDTMNIDPDKIKTAITRRTKAIVVVHYAGLICNMEQIMQLAKVHNLIVIEDAAQAFLSSNRAGHAGSFGDLACFSFHATKNIISGEGGALVINDKKYLARAEIIREKGTNRKSFVNGVVDKYTWVDRGSSFLPNELTAAFLYAQLQGSDHITKLRRNIFRVYEAVFDDANYEQLGWSRQRIEHGNYSNAHIFYIIAPDNHTRSKFISYLKENAVSATTHYEPLHKSSFGERNTKTRDSLSLTEARSSRLVRLPLWAGMEKNELQKMTEVLLQFTS